VAFATKKRGFIMAAFIASASVQQLKADYKVANEVWFSKLLLVGESGSNKEACLMYEASQAYIKAEIEEFLLSDEWKEWKLASEAEGCDNGRELKEYGINE